MGIFAEIYPREKMRQLSYWEKVHYSQADVCIIGAGITGLSAAFYLAGMEPSLRIVVLERGGIPYGASTRNAGFACFGSISEILEDISNEGRDVTMQRIETRWKGLQQLLALTGEESIRYSMTGGHEVFGKNDKDLYDECITAIDEVNKDLRQCFGDVVYEQSDDSLKDFGLSQSIGMISTRFEGSLDPVLMIEKLSALARQRNIRVIHGYDVKDIHNDGNIVKIHTSDLNVTARCCLVTTNGFASKFIKDIDVKPARAQVLITSEINGLKLKGCFHANRGYTYFRNAGNRVILGGGRDLAIDNEFTESTEITPQIQEYLEDFLRTRILNGSAYQVEQRWSGTMGLGDSKSPVIKKVGENIFCAVRLGGMGIAIGNHVGEQAASMIHSAI